MEAGKKTLFYKITWISNQVIFIMLYNKHNTVFMYKNMILLMVIGFKDF